jgi:hypothetical protein
MMRLKITFLVAVLLAFFAPAQAGPISGEPVYGGTMIVATDGSVRAIYLGSDAGYFNSLYLDAADPIASMLPLFLFDKHTQVGTTTDLGWFSAGTELKFRLDVLNTGDSFFTGEGLLNPDGLPHALAVTRFDEDLRLFVTQVGFEDLLGGGDLDYNDINFRLTNVYDPLPDATPEPSTLLLIGFGLACLGAILRRRPMANRSGTGKVGH